MLSFIGKRLGVAVLVALTVSFLAYMLVFLSGDPALALAGEGARAVDIEAIRHQYGFDRPIVVQYADWLGHLLRGDLGTSVYFKTEVAPLVLDKLQTTLLLGVAALGVALSISVPLGVLAAIYKHSWVDRLCLAVAVLGQALPNFFFALLLIMLFSIGAALAAGLGQRHLAASGDAGAGAGLLRGASFHAADPRRHDRGAGRRLHPHRPRQGFAAGHGDLQARAA